MKLAGCRSALNSPTPLPPVVYSTECSKAVVLVLFLLFIALCSLVVPELLFVLFLFFFYMWLEAVFNSCPLSVCFTICAVMLAFWSPSTAAHFAFCFTSCD